MMDDLDFDNSATQKRMQVKKRKASESSPAKSRNPKPANNDKVPLSRSRRRPAKNQQRIERNKQRKRQKVRSRIRRLPKGSLQNWLNCPPNIVTSCPQTPWRDNRSEPWMFCLRVSLMRVKSFFGVIFNFRCLSCVCHQDLGAIAVVSAATFSLSSCAAFKLRPSSCLKWTIQKYL